jgi:hypothetical protein
MKYFITVLLLGQYLGLISQSDTNTLYTEPQYKAGRRELIRYIQNYAICPIMLIEEGNGANLTATIYVSKTGMVKDVSVSTKREELKPQIKRLLLLSSAWIPGKVRGQAVDTFVTQKIMFSIQNTRLKDGDTTTIEILTYSVPYYEDDRPEAKKKRKEEREKYDLAKSKCEQGIKELNNNNLFEALKLFRAAEKEGYKTSVLYYNRAVAYIKTGQKDEACPDFREAARLGDEDAFNYWKKICR